jgi:hypothetical protein
MLRSGTEVTYAQFARSLKTARITHPLSLQRFALFLHKIATIFPHPLHHHCTIDCYFFDTGLSDECHRRSVAHINEEGGTP